MYWCVLCGVLCIDIVLRLVESLRDRVDFLLVSDWLVLSIFLFLRSWLAIVMLGLGCSNCLVCICLFWHSLVLWDKVLGVVLFYTNSLQVGICFYLLRVCLVLFCVLLYG